MRLLYLVMVGSILSVSGLRGQDPTRFESAIAAFEAEDAGNPPPPKPIVFVGSSSITQWSALEETFPSHQVLNRGFGGSVMTDVLHYFDRVIAVYQPSLVIVYEGDNDLAGGASVDEVYPNFVAFADRMREELPDSDFGFISVKPSPARRNILDEMDELNERLAILAAERDALFIDVFHPMLTLDGEPRQELFSSDNLHMNAAGYRIWRSIIGPVLDEWAVSPATLPRFDSVGLVDGLLVLEWSGDWKLATAPGPDGPWTEYESAVTSPFSIEPAKGSLFFRLDPNE